MFKPGLDRGLLLQCACRSFSCTICDGLIVFILYALCGDWTKVFLYMAFRGLSVLFFRTFGFRAAITIVNRIGLRNGLRLSIAWSVISLFALAAAYMRGADTTVLITISAITHGAGAWLYYNLFQSQLFSAVGNGEAVGLNTAKIRVVSLAGELSASFLVTLLAATGHITASLALAATSLFVSAFFLFGFDDKVTAQMPAEAPSPMQIVTALPWYTVLANWGLHGMFFGMISTVFLVSSAGVVDSLLLVSTLTLLKTILSVVIGRSVDKNQSAQSLVGCGVFSIFGPIATLFVAGNPFLLTCLRGCFDVSESGIAVGVESRMAKEVVQGCTWLNTACIEIARSQPDVIGYFLGYMLLITSPDAPMIMLTLGIPFAVLRLIYGLGGFGPKAKAVDEQVAQPTYAARLSPSAVPVTVESLEVA